MAVSDTTVGTESRRSQHDWIHIAGGRVCQKCRSVQLKGEFRDDERCGEPRSDHRADATAGS